MAQLETDSGGDAAVKAGVMKTWVDRRHWPATLRWQVEGLYMMPFDRLDRAADFIDEAVSNLLRGDAVEMTVVANEDRSAGHGD
jgi:hypothetical protein